MAHTPRAMLLSHDPRGATTPRAVEEHDFEQAAANIRPSWASPPGPGRSGAMSKQARTTDVWGAAEPKGSPAAPSWPAPASDLAFDDNPFAPRRRGLRAKVWLALLGLGCVGVGLAWLGADEPTATPATSAPASSVAKPPTSRPPEPAPSTPHALPSTGEAAVSHRPPEAAEQSGDEALDKGRTTPATKGAATSTPAPAKPAKLTADSKPGALTKPSKVAKPAATAKPATMAKPATTKPSAIAKPAAATKLGAGLKPAARAPAARAQAAKAQPRPVMRDLPVESTPSPAQRSLSNQFAPRRPSSEPIRSNPYE